MFFTRSTTVTLVSTNKQEELFLMKEKKFHRYQNRNKSTLNLLISKIRTLSTCWTWKWTISLSWRFEWSTNQWKQFNCYFEKELFICCVNYVRWHIHLLILWWRLITSSSIPKRLEIFELVCYRTAEKSKSSDHLLLIIELKRKCWWFFSVEIVHIEKIRKKSAYWDAELCLFKWRSNKRNVNLIDIEIIWMSFKCLIWMISLWVFIAFQEFIKWIIDW